MKKPKLFQRDNKGKIRFFRIQVKKQGTIATIIRKWGLLKGKTQIKITTVTKGKNIGRSNATTPYEQACNEATAMWKKQRDKGYKSYKDLGVKSWLVEEVIGQEDTAYRKYKWEDKTYTNVYLLLKDCLPTVATDAEGRFKPMLLHHARGRHNSMVGKEKEWKKAKQWYVPVTTQPKKDGVCALVSPVYGLTTRGGKDRLTPGGKSWNSICPHIYEAVKKLDPDFILHGEVYLHGHSLQTIQAACKKKNELSSKLELWVFDIADVDGKLAWIQRMAELGKYLMKVKELGLGDVIKFMPCNYCTVEDEVYEAEEFALSQGFEGLIIRKNMGKYKANGRSSDVLKMVREDNEDFEIHNIIPQDREPTHGLFVCKKVIGERTLFFNVSPSEFTKEERVDLLKNAKKYIGKMLKVKYRGETDDGKPKFCVGQTIRFDI